MESTLDCLAESVESQDLGLWYAKMSAHNPMTLCQNLGEIRPVVFEIWPIKDGPLAAEKRSTAPLWLFVATAGAA